MTSWENLKQGYVIVFHTSLWLPHLPQKLKAMAHKGTIYDTKLFLPNIVQKRSKKVEQKREHRCNSLRLTLLHEKVKRP